MPGRKKDLAVAHRGISPEAPHTVRLDAICSRNRYTTDPVPAIAELLERAADRRDLLAEAVGFWRRV